MKLKICGMKNRENILEISSLLPDYMGFIFWEKSSRFFDGEIPRIPQSIQKVGVFVDASLEEIILKIKKYQLDIVQLHGNEDARFCAALQKENVKIIKVFAIDNAFRFEKLISFETVCDYILFDTPGELPGGNGVVFNWERLKEYHLEKPFLLSGGIGSDAIDKIKALDVPIHGIDVNSKFEIEPGLKDYTLLKTFQNTLKNELSR